MFGIIKKMFIVLLNNIVRRSNHTKCISLSNQKCMTQPTLISLHTHDNSQEFHYYPFTVKLDRCVGNFNTIDDLTNKLCVPKKIAVLNLSAFIMISVKSESKILTKDISCECKCKLDGRKFN